jgi:protein-S-isoprenylcysteine O-methyltransferase Ste14
VLRILHVLGWLICAAYCTIPGYWLLIHPRVNYWRARQRSPYRVLLPVWVLTKGALLGITAPFRTVTLYQSGWAWLPATLLFALGIWLYKMGGANFSLKQLQGQPEISGQNEEQRLVTSGIRARLRHPIYLGHLCEMLAWSIGTGLVVCYGLTALAIFTGVFMIRAEDAELEQRFGDNYRRYRDTVPAVLPKLGNTVFRL